MNTKIIDGVMWLSISVASMAGAAALYSDGKDHRYRMDPYTTPASTCLDLNSAIHDQVSYMRKYAVLLMDPSLPKEVRQSGVIKLQSARDSMVSLHREASDRCDKVVYTSKIILLTASIDSALSNIREGIKDAE